MYSIVKTFEIAGAHSLKLNYESKCSNLHGHNWKVLVKCQSETLDENGMIVDFTHIKRSVEDKLDHKNLNEVFDFNPTAENIARWICEQIPNCVMVQIEESEGNIAIYEQDVPSK